MRDELYRRWQLEPLFALAESPCFLHHKGLKEPPRCLHRKGLKNKVINETGIVQAVAAWASVCFVALLEPPCCLHRKGLKNNVNNETRIVQAVGAWASVSSVRASMLPASQRDKIR